MIDTRSFEEQCSRMGRGILQDETPRELRGVGLRCAEYPEPILVRKWESSEGVHSEIATGVRWDFVHQSRPRGYERSYTYVEPRIIEITHVEVEPWPIATIVDRLEKLRNKLMVAHAYCRPL